jgi:hypothetical protein
MAHEQSPEHDNAAMEADVQEPTEPAYQPEADGEWPEESAELPRRPRRRLLTPLPLALLAVVIIACGFIAGVLVEKGQTSSSSSSGGTASLASRFAGLRAGNAGAGAALGASAGGAASGRGATGGGGAGGTGGGGATAGQVAYVSGSTLYVTTAEGNTVKVNTAAGSTVTKTVKATVKGIHPGETVLVTGAPDANGAVNAESIRVGAGAGGGLSALLGGSGAGAGAGGAGKTSGGSGGEQALFGKGG